MELPISPHRSMRPLKEALDSAGAATPQHGVDAYFHDVPEYSKCRPPSYEFTVDPAYLSASARYRCKG